jgi:son of sevenless-like protein
MDLFFQDDEETMAVDIFMVDHMNVSQSYEEIVKDLILEENQYLRDLNMIIRVFREPFVRLYPRSKVLLFLFLWFTCALLLML